MTGEALCIRLSLALGLDDDDLSLDGSVRAQTFEQLAKQEVDFLIVRMTEDDVAAACVTIYRKTSHALAAELFATSIAAADVPVGARSDSLQMTVDVFGNLLDL